MGIVYNGWALYRIDHYVLYRYVVGLVFGFEHMLLVMAVLLQWSINPVPKWVRVALARREHLAMKRAATAATGVHNHKGGEKEGGKQS